jgi:hypothetical protein
MRPNLDSLTEEIQRYLEAEHFVIFRGLSRAMDERNMVYWDASRYPDYKPFLDCALQLGVRLIHFHTREFTASHREEALEQLEEADLPREEKRSLEMRIQELALYEGFTCAIELSFDVDAKTYLFELQTDWYEDWHDILDEIEEALPDNEGPDSYGGYYSNN